MASLQADLADVQAAIAVVESGSKVPTRSRSTNVGPFVEEISEHAYQYGLPSKELRRIVNVLTIRNELDQTSRTTLIRNLVPAARVESSVVLQVVSVLGNGTGKPSAPTQALLVSWITAIHDVLEDSAMLLRVYGVLFNLLDLISIRTPLCQLLSLITRRKHVRPFRVQRLLTLCQQVGNDQALVSLLKVYKNFCPEIIMGQSLSGRPAQSPFDSEWRARLLAVQSAAQTDANNSTALSGFKVQRNGSRSTKSATIPEVQTFHGDESSVTLEEVNSVSDFVNAIERIDPPSQLIAALKDPLLRRYAALGVSPDVSLRLDFWLQRYLEDELEILNEGFGISTTLREILSGIVDLTEFNKQLNPVVERFLMAYLPRWDGSTNLGLLLDLVPYLPLQPFEDVYPSILMPLEQAVLNTAQNAFETLFDFYSKLVCNWMVNRNEDSVDIDQQLRTESLAGIHEHMSVLMSSALMASNTANNSIVGYLDSVSSSIVEIVNDRPKPNLPMINLPGELFYLLLFSSSLSTVSGLCAVLNRFYRSILKQPRAYPAAFTSTLNTYLMDSCNVLYRARAFVTTDKNAHGCLCPKATNDELQFYLPKVDREYSLASCFSLSYHPLVSPFATSSFNELEKTKAEQDDATEVWHKGPVGQRSLVALANEGGVNVSWKEYRIYVLKWLSGRGLNGIEEFLYAIIKDLTT